MNDVELVIRIPEYMFEDIQDRYKHPNKGDGISLLEDAVSTGTVLPKGHGRLSDVDWVLNKMSTTDAQPITPNEHYAWNFAKTLFRNAPTIIEADKGE